MVNILRLYQGGGMGPGHLPDAGGVLDQSVLMMSALNMMSDFDARQRDKDADPMNEDGEIDYAAKMAAAAEALRAFAKPAKKATSGGR